MNPSVDRKCCLFATNAAIGVLLVACFMIQVKDQVGMILEYLRFVQISNKAVILYR